MLLWTLDAAVPALALVLALVIDRLWGEPPAPLHPVVWMGRALGACGARLAPARATGRDLWSFWLAALIWCALAAIVLFLAAALQWLAWAYLPAWGVALVLCLFFGGAGFHRFYAGKVGTTACRVPYLPVGTQVTPQYYGPNGWTNAASFTTVYRGSLSYKYRYAGAGWSRLRVIIAKNRYYATTTSPGKYIRIY